MKTIAFHVVERGAGDIVQNGTRQARDAGAVDILFAQHIGGRRNLVTVKARPEQRGGSNHIHVGQVDRRRAGRIGGGQESCLGAGGGCGRQ